LCVFGKQQRESIETAVSVRRRYSTALQQQAVDYCLARRQHRDGVREVAAALGGAQRSLHCWMRTRATREGFHAVHMIDRQVPSGGAPLVVIVSDD
jgi:transposase-like protein